MKQIGSLLLLLALLLTGCGGVSKEEYDAACAERDALHDGDPEGQLYGHGTGPDS